MFAFSVYDKQTEKLFLARDRFGIKPLIYSFLNQQFIFTSELKPLLESNLLPKKLCREAVSEFFQYGSVRQPKTILEGVYQLMPGHTMTVGLDGSHEIRCYYDFVQEAQQRKPLANYKEAVAAVREELEVATRYHMVADVEVGAFLSGGVDSTATVALMQQYSDHPINTFSVGFAQKEGVVDETEVAERTAQALGTKHRSVRIDDRYVDGIIDDFIASLDQPSVDGINTYIVSRETARDIKVALSGLGGDELFAGYPHFATIAGESQLSPGLLSRFGMAINRVRPNRFTKRFEFRGVDAAVALDRQRTINRSLDNILKEPVCAQPVSQYPGLTPVQKITVGECDNYLLSTLLRDCDVLSMAHSLEVRPVVLDHKLAELAFSLADGFKIKDGELKSVFVDAVKDLIPQEVWKREKTGFEMPFASWLNGRLNKRFFRITHIPEAKSLFKAGYLKSLRHRIDQRTLKRIDWMSFVFLSWIERYEVKV
jgi:asparagine synthase (glutamine-hydrolysing)